MIRRHHFWIAKRFIKPQQLVFLDESWVKLNMTRLYGWSPVGERCMDYVPHGHWETMTILSAIRMSGVIAQATVLIDGSINGVTFEDYVENWLSPSLKPGDVVVMDNLASHKVRGVSPAIEAAGASLWYLPPYSPDLNPIEKLWSKVKAHLRRASARTVDHLCAAYAEAMRAVKPDECRNYFRSCGYGDCL